MRETANVFIVCKYLRRSRTLPLALPAILAKREEGGGGVPNPPAERGGQRLCVLSQQQRIYFIRKTG